MSILREKKATNKKPYCLEYYLQKSTAVSIPKVYLCDMGTN